MWDVFENRIMFNDVVEGEKLVKGGLVNFKIIEWINWIWCN